jgi:hypothetical protein
MAARLAKNAKVPPSGLAEARLLFPAEQKPEVNPKWLCPSTLLPSNSLQLHTQVSIQSKPSFTAISFNPTEVLVMADNTLLGPQPDFVQIGHAIQSIQSMGPAIQSVGTEIMKFQNIPAISQGNEILQAINQVANEVAGLRNDVAGLRNEVAGLRNEVAGLRNSLTAMYAAYFNFTHPLISCSEHNSLARLNNTAIRAADTALYPLRSTMANSEVPGFPATVGHLAAMTIAEIDPVLAAFGLSTAGGIGAKRLRLKFYIGLPQI